jgi:hypothetical protein
MKMSMTGEASLFSARRKRALVVLENWQGEENLSSNGQGERPVKRKTYIR